MRSPQSVSIRSSQAASAPANSGSALARNAALDFADADNAEKQISRSLPFEPRDRLRIALPPAGSRARSQSPSSVGISVGIS
jgi:hypothetical protein